MNQSWNGFTLVELLVVITLIVVLLALLTPALDRAVYQAELVVCSARLHATAVGATTYAGDSARWYPYRDMAQTSEWGTARTIAFVDQGYDLRPIIAQYIPISGLLDPLSPKVDFSPSATGPHDLVMSPYCLWFSFRYPGGKAMNRLGDRMHIPHWGGAVAADFRVLASCFDSIWETTSSPRAFNGHPDSPAVMLPFWRQKSPYTPALASSSGVTVGDPTTTYNITDSRWTVTTTWRRGLTDQNVAFDDVSVTRYDHKPWDVIYKDPRFEKVPWSIVTFNPQGYITLPRP
jgi:prepilin-type N-terminal cleavage/methylation domain-containing protein